MLPTVYAVGTVASGIGAIVPGLPAGTVKDDVLVLLVENQDATGIGAITNYAVVNTAFASTGSATRLTMLWRRADTGEAAPTVPDPGDHAVARIIGLRGCRTGGSPVFGSAATTELVSDTSVSIAGATTTDAECLIVAAFSTGTDVASTTMVSAFANASLASVTEQVDNWVIDGLGGGIGAATGTFATPGTYGATTATVVTAEFKAMVCASFVGNKPRQPRRSGFRPSFRR